jgi:hypothetical protein
VSLELPITLVRAYQRAARAEDMPRVERLLIPSRPSPRELLDAATFGHSGTWAWVRPGPGARTTVRRLAAAGMPVWLDQLARWPRRDVLALGEHFLLAPKLEQPIEPFYSVLRYLTPGGPGWSLRRASGDERAVCRPDWASPCATCEAFKCCGGFFRGAPRASVRCETWRRLHARLAAVVMEGVGACPPQ